MATEVRWRRGSSAEHETFTGAESEITVNTDDYSLHIHDGVTPGGIKSLTEGDVGSEAEHESPSGVEKLARLDRLVDSPFANKGFKNLIINGNFDIWQRGTSFTATSARTDYGPDRFIYGRGAEGEAKFERSTDTPEGFEYSIRGYELPEDSTGFIISQPIEYSNSKGLAGHKVTFSFWQKATKNDNDDIKITLRKLETKDDGIALGTALERIDVSSTSVWERKVVTFGELSESDVENGLRIDVLYENTGDFYTTGWQLEKGKQVTPFEHRPIGLELTLCQRYFCKTYSIDDDPGTDTFDSIMRQTQAGSSFSKGVLTWRFPVEMRTAPTVEVYAKDGTKNKIRNETESQNIDADTLGIGSSGASVRPNNSDDVNDEDALMWHAIADAEL